MSPPSVTGSDLKTVRRAYREAQGSARWLFLIVILELFAIPLVLLTPLPLAIAVDSALGDESVPRLLAAVVPDWLEGSDQYVLLLACVFQVVVVFLVHARAVLATYLQTSTGERITVRLRARLLSHAQLLSFKFHDSRGTADSIYRIQYDAPSLQDLVLVSFLPLVTAVATLGFMIVVIAGIDPALALVALAATPLLYVAARHYRRRIKPRYRELKRIESSALNVVQEIFSALRVVKAFGREDAERQRFTAESEQGADARVRVYVSEGLFELAVNLLTASGTALVPTSESPASLRGAHPGVAPAGAVLPVPAVRAAAGHQQAIGTDAGKDHQRRAGDRTARRTTGRRRTTPPPTPAALRGPDRDKGREFLLWRHPRPAKGVAGRTAGDQGGRRRAYRRGQEHPAQPSAALLRPDGWPHRAGRARHPQAPVRRPSSAVRGCPPGAVPVLLDHWREHRLWPPRRLTRRGHSGGGRRWRPRLRPVAARRLRHAGRGARHAPVGGERQRISLARAFLKDAPILLLDEPTSSVDVRTEDEIMVAMDRLMTGRTTFMIAHRLSTLEHCDLVVEIHDTRLLVAGRGPVPAGTGPDADGRILHGA